MQDLSIPLMADSNSQSIASDIASGNAEAFTDDLRAALSSSFVLSPQIYSAAESQSSEYIAAEAPALHLGAIQLQAGDP